MINEINNMLLITWAGMILLLIWLAVVTLKLRRLAASRRRLDNALEGDTEIDVILSGLINDVESLDRGQREIREILKKYRGLIGQTVRRVALVRYDAFSDLGGKMSFSAALLNEKGDGLVLSSINGRSEGRIYAKPVKELSSIYPLSEEENEAIKQAMGLASSNKQVNNVIELEQSR